VTVRGLLRGGAPYFLVWVRTASIRGAVWLLADTGAPRTTLLDTGAKSLHIPPADLEPAPSPMVGIGGVTRCSILRNAEIRLQSDEGDWSVLHDLLITQHDLQTLWPAGRSRVLNLPSILGRDIIDRFRFIYEHATGTVLLEG